MAKPDYRRSRDFASTFFRERDAGVAKLLESVLNQVFQAQVTEQIGAKPYERTDERKGYRNGSYSQQLTTRVGTINLRIPCIRKVSSPPNCLLVSTERKIPGAGLNGDGGQWGFHP